MCGIVGFINNDHMTQFGDKARLVFEQLLWHSTQRGPNGTGVLAVTGIPGSFTTTMYKNAMWAPEYLGYHTYRDLIQRKLGTARVAIGHNRATTSGSVRHENAHPFEHKHITLVQNGYIAQPNSHLPYDVRHDVDSYTAAWLIAEKGAKAALEAMTFGGVFVWWDATDGTLNMARNEQRELWCVGIKGQNAMFYASEWQMLHWILSRNGLEPDTKYLLLSPNVWFKFDPTKPKEWEKTPFVNAPPQNQQQAARGPVGVVQGGPAGGKTYNNTASITARSSKRIDQITESEVDFVERQFARLSAKERTKYGFPESRHRLKKTMAKIENTGIPQARFGAKFVIYPDAWVPYKNQKKLGAITGSKRANADIKVELPNTSKEEYELCMAAAYAFATIVNAKKAPDGTWKLVMALIPEAPAVEVPEGAKTHTKTDGTQATLIRGPRGSFIELGRFQALTQNGCGECTGFINPNYAHEMEWFGDEPICHICADEEIVREKLGFTKTKQARH